jgi:hypothetical protein
MALVTGKNPSVVVGRAAAEAFVKQATSAPVGGIHQEYAAFLATLTGGAQKEFNGFVLEHAPDVAALLKLSDNGVSPALHKALQSAFDGGGDKLRWAPARSGDAPFYGAHFPPVDIELSGQKFRVFISAEEQKFGPPSRPEDSNVAVLQRSDGALSSDLSFRVGA